MRRRQGHRRLRHLRYRLFGPRCGDGIIRADQGEPANDGNNIKLDGCSACKLEQIS